MGKKALIWGASGVTGWSFVNEILNDYPEKGTWDSVTALTNRPLKQEDSLWPRDSRLQIVSGVNLLAGQEDIEAALKEHVKDIDKITHASTDLQQEFKDAVTMFKQSTIALDRLSPALEFVVLQTGAKIYGCHLLENHPTDYIHVPLAESMPRLKQPYHDLLFYHPQLDWIREYAKEKKWNWCDTRPDIIIGFVPNQNAYSLAQSIALFLTLYAVVEGTGAECPFPGTQKSWVAKSIDSSSDMIARQTIHLSLNLTAEPKGEAFNVADARTWSTWSERWPQITKYFGLVGTGPTSTDKAPLEVRKYINDHIDTWRDLEKKYNLKQGVADSDLTFPGFERFLLTDFDFDRQYDMTKMYSTPPENPFVEERSTAETWGGVFDRMREGRLIPKDVKVE
ncbi:Hypothetical predicted protein [Lecanosticta acicola]|uniref:PRISE-like Rossmann-fold domain-containing protein n=1 Tax=Lecanosticta acicola TaxID=111012 RepID=A0AAI8Z3U0_9PEZI|nr:Hypothetical predicted protein [Lecanosticta acicola]